MSRYPSAVNLPFNNSAIRDGFEPSPNGQLLCSLPGYWIILRGSGIVVAEGSSRLSLPEGDLPVSFGGSAESLTIGSWLGRPLRVVVVSREASVPDQFRCEEFNAINNNLDDVVLTLGGVGKQILHWERQSVCCPRCGTRTERLPASWGKVCRLCRVEHYPHIHPCIIVLIRRGDEFLLVRKAEWAEGRYSLVAGFLDFGESLEECVHREVKEEVGVRVKNLIYVGSQSWPFPSQVMAGFVADYEGGEIMVDSAELEDARWFNRQQLPDSFPQSRSIARWIIDNYALAG